MVHELSYVSAAVILACEATAPWASVTVGMVQLPLCIRF